MVIDQIPEGECFSSNDTKGSYYKERKVNGEKQTFHKYNENGELEKTQAFPSLNQSKRDWYVSYADGSERRISNTIDELITELQTISKRNFKRAIEMFLHNKILIDKGKYRHAYADLFHRMVEDLTLIVERSTTGYDRDYKEFVIPYGQYQIKENAIDVKSQYAMVQDDGSAKLVLLTETEAKNCQSKLHKIQEQ